METYHGYVRTPSDAIKLFEACRLGLLPRVQRRLSEKERQSIRSGSVFVWDEREAGMRRWTDGKSWSASRVSGSFLTYREMEGKRGAGFTSNRRSNGRTPESGRVSDEDPEGEPEGYRYKVDGLMKQSFSITTSQGQHLHLISYYSRPHPGAPDLPQPNTDPQLRHIIPAKGMYPESSLHDANPPALTRGPMQHTPEMAKAHHVHYHQRGAPMAPRPLLHIPPPGSQLPPPLSGAHGGQPPFHQMKPLYPYEHERHERLPPPSTMAHYQHLPPATAPPPSMSPRAYHLQSQAAQAAMVDPIAPIATSARNPQGPLPAMSAAGRGLTPPRTHSASPSPRVTLPELNYGNKKASLASLLHPTPANSEPGSAHSASINSANNSPRAKATGAPSGLATGNDMSREDAKALRSLDRKFLLI
ncbi:Gti1/Pac2 family-domain-containing protein [Microdochium trichocladiopsis]|uniref:Gti1/Pac2 family-domain-containing protein n=1 Tax=Microdochium trichocladiopsis TaxID=1682393 RepID=A0A9P8Y3T3_9PEZI|nr:Gti1/Pac2 family-domain-containing protein [Microdochium trichocladiopsis]KAH7029208.1 Gti1/Pac2 family-domain-containing protein [Microdochium trichocladiopsis]